MSRGLRLLGLAVVTSVWFAALVGAPFAVSLGTPAFNQAAIGVYAAGSLICHQRPERSFQFHDTKLPVCARCFGLYASGLLGMFAWIAAAGARSTPAARVEGLRPATWRWWLIAAAIPTLVSIGTAFAGVWDPPNVVRALFAVPLGVVVGMIVTAVVAGDLR